MLGKVPTDEPKHEPNRLEKSLEPQSTMDEVVDTEETHNRDDDDSCDHGPRSSLASIRHTFL